MKIETQLFVKKSPLAVVLITLLISGCGGGGGASVTAGPAASALSSVQQAYESVALAANGGFHYLAGSLSFSTSSTGVLTVAPSSYFYTVDSSIPQTAANGPQPISVAYTSVASTLAVPALGAASRYLINGSVYMALSPEQPQVSYTGNNVLENYFAADGKTVVETLLGTSYTVIPLSGLIQNSPAELFTNSNLGLITNTINGNSLYNVGASWQSGSAYVKAVKQSVGDTVLVNDCLYPVTTGPNITPCSTNTSTLQGFFPHLENTNGVTYNSSDGQFVTLAGVSAWVSNTALPLSTYPTTEYQVYYLNNGNIYRAVLLKAGTPLQITPLGGGSPQNFEIFLNSAARQSIKSAVNF